MTRDKQVWTLSEIAEGGARSDYHDRSGSPQFCPRDRACGCDNAAEVAIRGLSELSFDPSRYQYRRGGNLPATPGLYEQVAGKPNAWKLVVACPDNMWPERLRLHLDTLIGTYRETGKMVLLDRTARIVNGLPK